MSRLLALMTLSGSLALSSGCAMCCAPLDYNYQSVAGRWMRTNPTSGRVGSIAGGGAPMVPMGAPLRFRRCWAGRPEQRRKWARRAGAC